MQPDAPTTTNYLMFVEMLQVSASEVPDEDDEEKSPSDPADENRLASVPRTIVEEPAEQEAPAESYGPPPQGVNSTASVRSPSQSQHTPPI